MTIQGRAFGKPPALQYTMQRGEQFFDAITATDIDEVLERSKRISKIAFTAAAMAGEKLQLEGDGDSKRLIFAAYLNIGDLMRTIASDSGMAETKRIMESDQTHRTLLLASSALNSVGLDRAITAFRKQGAYFDTDENGLTFDGHHLPRSIQGSGCPYAKGNIQKAEYFRECTDHIVATYARATELDMPYDLKDQIKRYVTRAD